MIKFRKYFVCKKGDKQRMTHAGQLWYGMKRRANCLVEHPSYEGVSISDEFMDFQQFAQWLYSYPYYNRSYHLDKDILVKGNKVYSPEFCALVPMEVNSFLTHVKSTNSGLPIGVKQVRNTFKVYGQFGNNKVEYGGSFSTPEQAHEKYRQLKAKRGVELATKWSGKLCPNVIKALNSIDI